MRRRNFFHALDHLDAALRLARFRCLVAKAVDEALQVLDLLLLPGIHRLLQRELLGAQLLELAVITGEQVDSFVFDVRDARTDLIEKISIV